MLAPNGFHRRLIGRGDLFSVALDETSGDRPVLRLTNLSPDNLTLAMSDMAYGAPPEVIALAPGEVRAHRLDLAESYGWYDRSFSAAGQTWRIAGHVEDGAPSYSDPAGGGPGPLRLASAA